MLASIRTPGSWVVFIAVIFLFTAHIAIGANSSALAIIFSVGAFGICVVVLAFTSRYSWIFANKSVKAIFLLFLLTLAALSFQLTPLYPGGSHPFWQWTSTSGSVSLNHPATIRELLKLSSFGVLGAIGLYIGAHDRRAKLFFQVFLIAGSLLALWAFIQYTTAIGNTTIDPEQGPVRLTSSFLSANSAASFFGILTLLSMAALGRQAKRQTGSGANSFIFIEQMIKTTPVILFSFLFSTTALVLTASRSGIAVNLFIIIFFASWEFINSARQKGKITKVLFLQFSSLALLLSIFLFSNDLFLSRLIHLEVGTNDRTIIYTAHWQAFLAAPWSGYGMGTFYQINDMVVTTQNWSSLNNLGATHNVYVQWLEEAGLIGAIPMWTTLALVLLSIFRGLQTRRRMLTWIRAILCVSAAVLLHGGSDYALQVPSIAMTWSLLLGVGVGLSCERPGHRG